MDVGALAGLAVIAAVAVGVAALGIVVGMRLAPRIERWGSPKDDETEDNGGDDKP